MQVAIEKKALNDASYCGDACAVWQVERTTMLCVVDGLGHGPGAEIAANAAIDYIANHFTEDLHELFTRCDVALQKTRGVAMGIAIINEDSGKLTYAGVGNTRGLVVGATSVRMVSNYGIVGAGYKSLTPESFLVRPGELVVLMTDGITEIPDLSNNDQTESTDIQKLAGRILQDFRSETDDAAVLIYRREIV